LEEFGQQERSELLIHNHVRGCSYFSPFPTDVEGIIEDRDLFPPVWIQDTFAGGAGTGVVYHPQVAVLPDHSVEHIPTTCVFDFLEDTGGPKSQPAQFSSPEITSNLSQDIIIDSSAGLSSTSIKQPAVEKSGILVESLDTLSGEMPSWDTLTLGSSAPWKVFFVLEDQKQLTRRTRKWTPSLLEKRQRGYALRQRHACISCSLRKAMCSQDSTACPQCVKTNDEPFQILNANNNLLRSHLSIARIELEKRSYLVYCHPRTVFHINELRSDSSEGTLPSGLASPNDVTPKTPLRYG
jgi:hypothetical protein